MKKLLKYQQHFSFTNTSHDCWGNYEHEKCSSYIEAKTLKELKGLREETNKTCNVDEWGDIYILTKYKAKK